MKSWKDAGNTLNEKQQQIQGTESLSLDKQQQEHQNRLTSGYSK